MSKWKKPIHIPIAIGIAVSLIWLIQIVFGYMPYTDRLLGRFVEQFHDTYVYTFFRFMTDFGSGHFLIPFTIVLTVLLIFIYRSFLPAFIFAGGTLCTHLLNLLIKYMVERERPSLLEEANALGYSFPSGHAMISLVCYGLAVYFIRQKIVHKQMTIILQLGTFLFIMFIGLSRYVIHVHYMTDVIAGFVMGLILLHLFISLYEKIRNRKKNDLPG